MITEVENLPNIIIVTTSWVSENDELKSAQWKVQMSHGLCMCAYMDRTESELPRGSEILFGTIQVGVRPFLWLWWNYETKCK